ncbi:hypothetical protein M5K25_010783 [Dendrobium thyrsiflorum]|uniref:Uncharacterized protein n=1 Tax=Dendrobium thyrsiflorum TaxID=117978 RepID=A0ABD0V0Z6_DENTH
MVATPQGVPPVSLAANRIALFDPGFLNSGSTTCSFKVVIYGSMSCSSFLDLKSTAHCGMTTLWVTEEEVMTLEAPFQFVLVGKFPLRKPKLDLIRHFIFNLKLYGNFSVTVLDPRHVLIKLEKDLYCSCIFVNNAIAVGSRLSVASVLVELDITKQYPNNIWLGPEKLEYVQEVMMNDFPTLSDHCKTSSHHKHECFHLNPSSKKNVPIKSKTAVDTAAPIRPSQNGGLMNEATQDVNVSNLGQIAPPYPVLNDGLSNASMENGTDNISKCLAEGNLFPVNLIPFECNLISANTRFQDTPDGVETPSIAQHNVIPNKIVNDDSSISLDVSKMMACINISSDHS